MTNLSSPRRHMAGLSRQLALALALAAGTAVLAVPGFADAAYAQKKKKDEGKGAAKQAYSKEFVAAYNPLDTALKAPGADVAALKPQILALVPLANSPDEKQAVGSMMFNSGIGGKDEALQLQGVDMMLASGKLPDTEAGRFNLVGFQIANARKQYDLARTYLQRAIDLNYTSEFATADDLKLNVAELYFSEDRNVEGLKYLSDLIAANKAKGEQINAKWYRRGVAVAYTNEIVPQVYEFVADWVVDYPAPENWRDAVNLTRNLNDFDFPVLLDLLRLGQKVGTLNSKNDYIAFVEAADARRLPQEVKTVIEQAYNTQTIPRGSDSFIDDQYKVATSRIAADKAELPVLERDASAASAQGRTVVAAGDVFLSYGEYGKAATYYEKALGIAGVDRNLALTRLGIAQIGKGDTAAARESLGQVEGTRLPVARLWGAYAAQQAGAASGG